MNPKTVVNAKTPRGKDAKGREMGRNKLIEVTHPAGEDGKQPKALRLCTFAPLR
jgi:hypothetical protein